MQRQEFLAKLGIGLAAVCAGCSLASCGSKPGDDPAPNTGTNPPNGSGGLFTVNLGSELKNVGEFKVSNGVILVRLADGSTASAFTAVQVACTHQGTSINYNNAQGKFICPNHGSEFSTTGTVLLGPAAAPLRVYNVAIANNVLTVSA